MKLLFIAAMTPGLLQRQAEKKNALIFQSFSFERLSFFLDKLVHKVFRLNV